MNIAVLRATGSDAALASLRATLPLDVCSAWKKGDSRKLGGFHKDSGFNADVSDVFTPAALVTEVRDFLKKCKAENVVLASADLETAMDLGIGVGLSTQYFASVVFAPDDMRLYSELGIALHVSAYPQSDDEA